jgi:hypothetical protein
MNASMSLMQCRAGVHESAELYQLRRLFGRCRSPDGYLDESDQT